MCEKQIVSHQETAQNCAKQTASNQQTAQNVCKTYCTTSTDSTKIVQNQMHQINKRHEMGSTQISSHQNGHKSEKC